MVGSDAPSSVIEITPKGSMTTETFMLPLTHFARFKPDNIKDSVLA